MTHMCLWNGCKRVVPDHLALCGEHWRIIPAEHQRAIRGSYTLGQTASTASSQWHRAIAAMNGWVAKTFGTSDDRPRRSWDALCRMVRERDEARAARRKADP